MMSASNENIIELRQIKPTESHHGGTKRSDGCHVTRPRAILFVVIAIALAVLVGLVVHYASPKPKPSTCVRDTSDKPSQLTLDQCRRLAVEQNTCINSVQCHKVTNRTKEKSDKKDKHRQNIRLPLKIFPLHYNLELTPDIYRPDPDDFALRGHVTIVVQCAIATDVITLHINKLYIDGDIGLDDLSPSGYAPAVRSWSIDKTRQMLIIKLDGLLTKDRQYVLDIKFHGDIRDDLTGLYWSSYTDGFVTRYLATTQMQPTDARKAFPCFDEPAIKATYDVTLVRKANMKSLANADKLRTEQRSDGWLADVYNTTLKMSTYLLAFIVSDFKFSEKYTSAGTRVRVWSRPKAVEQTKYTVDVATNTIVFYEDYFGIPFPLSKEDMVAVPDFMIGAMENWGLITFREQGILYKANQSSVVDRQWLVELVVHELAHQWFGNLVTPTWWDDLWLNEGFASYMEYIAMDYLYPEWKMGDQFVVRDLHQSLDIDSLSNSHPIYVPVNDPDEINEIFDRISYLKGASVIRMMNHFLGDDIFRTGLAKYLMNYAYRNANHSNLWEQLTVQARDSGLSIDVSDIMNTWVRQMGYPVVFMDTTGDEVRVSQRRFLKDPQQDESKKYISPYGYKWNIPITFATDQSPADFWVNPPVVWLWRNQSSMSLSGVSSGYKWLIGNVGQFGYYRVNYDTANWLTLTRQLNDNHTKIPVKSRAQIIDDAINLGRSGYLDQLIGIKVTQYLDREMEYVPWRSAVDSLSFLDNMLKFSKYYGAFKRYLLSKIVPVYHSIGVDYRRQTEAHLDRHRQRLISQQACYYGHRPCQEEALVVFRQWMEDPASSPLNPDQRVVIFCNGIRLGSEAEWDFLYQHYKQTNLAAEASSILEALSCSQDPWILNRFLHYALNEKKIRRQDGLAVIKYVAQNAVGNQLAWNFYRENWPAIRETWGSGFGKMSRVIEAITATFNTRFQLEQLVEFVEKHPDLGTGSRAFAQAIEVTKHNAKWIKTNLDSIGRWLLDK